MIVFKRKFRFWLWLFLVVIFVALLIASFYKGATPSFGAAGSVTLQPGSEGKDTHAREWVPGSAGGSDTSINAGGGDFEPLSARGYLEFDISSVPSDATINSAVLYLYYHNWYGPNDVSESIGAHKVTSSWGEGTLTWNSQPSYGSSVASTTVGNSSSYGWYSWDITFLVAGWKSGSIANYGVVLKDPIETADTAKVFYSSDFGTASLRPKLEIIYTTDDPVPDPDPDPDPDDPTDPTDPNDPANPDDPTDPTNSTNPDNPTDPDDPVNPDDSTVGALTKIFQQSDGIRQLTNDVAKLASESSVPQVVLATAGALSMVSVLTVVATSLATQVGIKELLFVIINYFLTLFAAKKRDKAGLVYDQGSKEAVIGALVNLHDFKTMKLIASAITDHKGHYFFTVKTGDYVMSVVKKGYIFPSHFAKSEKTLNEAVYFGQTMNVKGAAKAINIKIPIDPTAKAKSSRTILKILMYSSLIRVTIMIIGTSVSLFALIFHPILINYIMTAGYIVLWAMEYFVQHRELKFSKIIDKDSKQPIDLAMTRVVSESGKIKKTYVTDFGGRFIPYLPERDDSIIIERAGYDRLKEKPGKSGFVEGKTYLLQKK